jgi:hypothetical protein
MVCVWADTDKVNNSRSADNRKALMARVCGRELTQLFKKWSTLNTLIRVLFAIALSCGAEEKGMKVEIICCYFPSSGQ